MNGQVINLMCQATETSKSLGATWKCILPAHNDEHHFFEIIEVFPIIPETEKDHE